MPTHRLTSGLALLPGQLAPYDDPARYDRRYGLQRDDVDYYVRAAKRTGGTVLEYGAGTGRVTLPLARAGVRVTGVDLSEKMLAQLRRHLAREPAAIARRVTLKLGDMRQLRLRSRFDLVIVPFNAFQHLYSRTDVEMFLGHVWRHAKEGARLLFDVYLPNPAELDGLGDATYDPITQILHTVVDEGGAVLSQRQFFPMELRLLLTRNGFEQVTLRSDFTNNKLSGETISIVVSARRSHRRYG